MGFLQENRGVLALFVSLLLVLQYTMMFDVTKKQDIAQHLSSNAQELLNSPTDRTPDEMVTKASSVGDDERSAPKKFAVWMFPFPPPPDHERRAPSSDEALVCPYENACGELRGAPPPSGASAMVDLRSLTTGTYFHNYVRDHAFHKTRHRKEFPHHIQAIAMMAILRKWPGSCVRTLGDSAAICDPAPYRDYDPYEDGGFNETKYPLEFLRVKGSGRDGPFLAPDMDEESFAIWGVDYARIKDSGYAAGRYNSGEDVQALASAGWLPFVSEVRDKRTALNNYTGYYVANALVNFALQLPKNTARNREVISRMKKVSLLSIFYATEKLVRENEDYIRTYTENVEAFGCRSKKTCRIMQKNKIKSYFSSCLTLTMDMMGAELGNSSKPAMNDDIILKPGSKALPTNKTLILMIDVQDAAVVPKAVKNRALRLTADIPRSYPNDPRPYLERNRYAYRLLSKYANQAKVVITSRIHVGLPAAALGVPVIFVSKNGGWLPGGKESTGRVEGLLEVFHQVDAASGKKWTFGDLRGPVPPSPGNHLADRYRASFWNRLKRRSDFHGDTAKLFGMVPLRRLGRKNMRYDLQTTFHFVLNRNDLSVWQTKRAIEHVFYFHPNSQVYVHLNDLETSDLEIFVESGYDFVVQTYDVDQLKKNVLPYVAFSEELLIEAALVPFLLLWKYGGVFVSKNTFVRKEIPLSLEHGVVSESDGSVALMLFAKHSADAFALMKPQSTRSWNVPILSGDDTVKCMKDESWTMNVADESLAVSLDPSTFSAVNVTKRNSECFRLLEEPCIYCDEIHWEFGSSSVKKSLRA